MKKHIALTAAGIVLATAFMASCTSQETDTGAKYSIGIVPEEGTLRFSDIYGSCRTVNLSGTLVSGVSDVIILKDKLIVKGKSSDAAISAFSLDGEYLAPVMKIGRGPDEMADIQAMKYNPYTETIDVLGNIGTTLFKFDIATLQLTGSFSIMESEIMSASDFCPVDKDRYMFYKDYSLLSEQEYYLYIHNITTSQTEERYLPMDKWLVEILSFDQTNNLYMKDGAVYFYTAFGKYIHRYSGGELGKYVGFIQNEYFFPDNLLHGDYKDVGDFVDNVCRPSPYIWGHICIYQYRDHLFSTYTYKNTVYGCHSDLSEGKSDSFTEIEDDMVWGVTTDKLRETFLLCSATDRNVIYVAEPFTLKGLVSGQDYGGDSPVIKANREDLMAMPDDANPVLLIME